MLEERENRPSEPFHGCNARCPLLNLCNITPLHARSSYAGFVAPPLPLPAALRNSARRLPRSARIFLRRASTISMTREIGVLGCRQSTSLIRDIASDSPASAPSASTGRLG